MLTRNLSIRLLHIYIFLVGNQRTIIIEKIRELLLLFMMRNNKKKIKQTAKKREIKKLI